MGRFMGDGGGDDVLGFFNVVLSTAYISLARLCTGKYVCPPKWHAFLDDVMSQSELITQAK